MCHFDCKCWGSARDIVSLLFPCCPLQTRSCSSWEYAKLVCFFLNFLWYLSSKKSDLFLCVCVFMLGVGASTWNSRVFAHAKSGPAKTGQLVVSCGKSVLQYLSLLLILWSKCVIVPGKGELGWFWIVTNTAVSLTMGKLGLGVFYCRLSKSAALMWVQGGMWCSVSELVAGRAVSGGNPQVARPFWVLWPFFKSHRSSSSNRPIWSKK